MSLINEPQYRYLKALEAESIHIFREVASSFRKPVILYSVGKDSSVMLRLAEKAFFPGKIPFPLMHVDTGYKFPEMITFRDEMAKKLGARLIIEGAGADPNAPKPHPLDAGLDRCCAQLKTGALLQALKKHGFNAAIGGARRDEEKSRAKERIFSVRDEFGQWNPKLQRPELWNTYNTELPENGSTRVFPISNWTEKDIWQYILVENIPVVPLYFAQKRRALDRGGVLMPEQYFPTAFNGKIPPGELKEVFCRYRSLGCIPCTGAVESSAATVEEIIEELFFAKKSERENRLIDNTGDASMEQKKREGYF